MYRGSSNPDYHRAPVPSSGFGHPVSGYGPPSFCPPYAGPPGPGYSAPPPGPHPGHVQASPYSTVNDRYRETFYEVGDFTDLVHCLICLKTASCGQNFCKGKTGV